MDVGAVRRRGKACDFVDGQFLINTTVAPPWGAEIIIPTPRGRAGKPVARHARPATSSPCRKRRASTRAVPERRIVPAGAGGSEDDADSLVECDGAAADRQRRRRCRPAISAAIRAISGTLRSINPGVYLPQASCTLPDGRTYAPCSTNTNLNSRRLLSMQNWTDGQLLGARRSVWTTRDTRRTSGMLLTFQRRSVSGLSVNGNYTLSKCMGHPTQGGGTPNVNSGYADPNNIDYDYGPCNADRRHIFNLSVVAATPDFSGGMARALASGWRLSGAFRAASGAPLQILVTGDPARTGLTNQRPNLVAGVSPCLKRGTAYLQSGGVRDSGRSARSATCRAIRLSGRAARRGSSRSSAPSSSRRPQTIEARVEAFNVFNWFRPRERQDAAAGADRHREQSDVRTDSGGCRSAYHAVRR